MTIIRPAPLTGSGKAGELFSNQCAPHVAIDIPSSPRSASRRRLDDGDLSRLGSIIGQDRGSYAEARARIRSAVFTAGATAIGAGVYLITDATQKLERMGPAAAPELVGGIAVTVLGIMTSTAAAAVYHADNMARHEDRIV